MKILLQSFSCFLMVLLAVETNAQTAKTTTTKQPTTNTSPTPKSAKVNDPSTLSWRKNRKEAKNLIKKGNYYSAVKYLEAGAAKKPKKVYFPEKLATAEMALRDYKSANKWYKVLVDKDTAKHKNPMALFNYALTQKYLGQYEESKNSFKSFIKYAKDDELFVENKKRAKREIVGCDKGIFYRDSFTKPAFKIRHLDANINNPYTDFGPNFRDANTFYFGSLKSDKVIEVNGKQKFATFSHIYKSTRTGKEYSPAEEITETINVNNSNTGNPAFTGDGSTMYYTECTHDDLLKLHCQILYSKNVNGIWEKGKSVGAAVNDGISSNTHPAVGKNKDGEAVLYFTSDRNLGKGTDIFYGKLNTDGSVSKPRSAGSLINTKYDEATPYFDNATNTLYFSSNGWINIGGMDVYKTTWDNGGEWTEPENVGTPVNSSVDDMYFTLNNTSTKGFVVSNRPGGFGLKSETCCDDIYALETTKVFLAVKGRVYEVKGQEKTLSDNAMVVLTDERNGTELGAYNVVNGAYFYQLEPNRGYKVAAKKDGYIESQVSFNTDNKEESDTAYYELAVMKKVEVTNPLLGRNIGILYYDYDQARLRADSRDTLKKVNEVMNQYQNIIVEVGSHTDGKGTAAYNEKLSQKRAESVTNYMVQEKKINSNRLISKAYGLTTPAMPNTNPDGTDNPANRAKNRRTEFKIIDEIKTP